MMDQFMMTTIFLAQITGVLPYHQGSYKISIGFTLVLPINSDDHEEIQNPIFKDIKSEVHITRL